MIAIDRYFGDQIPCVASDNYAGGALAARKLAENGSVSWHSRELAPI